LDVHNELLKKRFPSTSRGRTAFYLISPAVFFLFVMQVYPILYALYLSFFKTRGRSMSFVGLDNYLRLLSDTDFWASLRHTFFFTAGYLVLTLCLSLFLALLLNRRMKLSPFYILVIFTPWVLSPVIAGTMWRWLFQPAYGVLQFLLEPIFHKTLITDDKGAMGIVILALSWRNLPLTTLLFLGGLQTISSEIYECASLDGATAWQRFSKITMPLMKPSLLINILINTIRGINVISIILSITRGGPGRATEVLGIFLYRNTWQYGDFGTGAALGILMFLLTGVVSLIYLRTIKMEN
jgi:multiple sugar transport system permease protein